MLGPIDEAGQRAFRSLQQVAEVSASRATATPGDWDVLTYTIDGALLERWFLKTAINLFISTTAGGLWYFGDCPASQPPHNLVKAAFGLASPPAPMGLYAAVQPGNLVHSVDAVDFTPVFDSGERLSGGFFGFRGWRFLLWLCPDLQPASGTSAGVVPAGAPGSGMLYHPQRIDHRDHGRKSQIIEFEWVRH
jgi:hypothetical protein